MMQKKERAILGVFLLPACLAGCDTLTLWGIHAPAGLRCGSGCAPESASCRSQCELQAASCNELPIEEFDDFDTRLGRLQAGEDLFGEAVAGECQDGTVFLFEFFGEGSLTHYFEPMTGAFFALETLTDMRDFECGGRGYWPVIIDCANPVVTEVIRSAFLEVGDPVNLRR